MRGLKYILIIRTKGKLNPGNLHENRQESLKWFVHSSELTIKMTIIANVEFAAETWESSRLKLWKERMPSSMPI